MLQLNRGNIYTQRDTACLEDSKTSDPEESLNGKSDATHNKKDDTAKISEVSGIIHADLKSRSPTKKCVRFAIKSVAAEEEDIKEKTEEDVTKQKEDASGSTLASKFRQMKVGDARIVPGFQEPDTACEVDNYDCMESAGTRICSVGRRADSTRSPVQIQESFYLKRKRFDDREFTFVRQNEDTLDNNCTTEMADAKRLKL